MCLIQFDDVPQNNAIRFMFGPKIISIDRGSIFNIQNLSGGRPISTEFLIHLLTILNESFNPIKQKLKYELNRNLL